MRGKSNEKIVFVFLILIVFALPGCTQTNKESELTIQKFISYL